MNMRMNGNDSTAAWRLLRWLFRTLSSSSSSSGDIQSMLLSNRHSWAVHWVCGVEGVEVSSKPPEILARKLIIGTFRRMTMAGKTVFWFFRLFSVRAGTAAFACRLANWIFMVELSESDRRQRRWKFSRDILPINNFMSRAAWHSNVVRKTIVIRIFIVDPSFLFSPFPNFLFLLLRGENNKPKVDAEEKNERKFNLQLSHIAVSYQFLIQCIHRLGFDFDLIRCYDCSRVKMETIKIVIEEWRRGGRFEWKCARRVKLAGDAWFNDTWCEVIIYDLRWVRDDAAFQRDCHRQWGEGGLCRSVWHYSTELYGVIEKHQRRHRESIASAQWDSHTEHIDDTYTWCDVLNFMCCWWISSGSCLVFFFRDIDREFLHNLLCYSLPKKGAAVLPTLRARRTKYVSRCKHSKCWYSHPNSLFSPLLLLPMILSMIFDVYKYLMSSLRFFFHSFTLFSLSCSSCICANSDDDVVNSTRAREICRWWAAAAAARLKYDNVVHVYV